MRPWSWEAQFCKMWSSSSQPSTVRVPIFWNASANVVGVAIWAHRDVIFYWAHLHISAVQVVVTMDFVQLPLIAVVGGSWLSIRLGPNLTRSYLLVGQDLTFSSVHCWTRTTLVVTEWGSCEFSYYLWEVKSYYNGQSCLLPCSLQRELTSLGGDYERFANNQDSST